MVGEWLSTHVLFQGCFARRWHLLLVGIIYICFLKAEGGKLHSPGIWKTHGIFPCLLIDSPGVISNMLDALESRGEP